MKFEVTFDQRCAMFRSGRRMLSTQWDAKEDNLSYEQVHAWQAAMAGSLCLNSQIEQEEGGESIH